MSRATVVLSLALSLASSGVALAEGSGPIDPARLSDLTRTLSGDEFEGRSPGSAGETRTLEWLTAQFKGLGLEGGGDKGGFTQEVPLLRTQVVAEGAAMAVKIGGDTLPMVQMQQVYANSLQPTDHITITDAPMVFVGYGVNAPERGWDDFKGVDLKGKVAVVLINDPDFEAEPGDAVAGKFGGQAATFYARWVYKYEEAVRRGAVAVLIVHETAGAAYGWSTVIAPAGENFDIVRADPAKEKLQLQGWIQRDVAVDLFRRAGLDFEAQKRLARTAAFQPVGLGDATFSAHYKLTATPLISHNLIAVLPGTTRKTESVSFGAHWDAYGVGAPDAKGDRIRNGAADDAIGVAGLLELARAYKAGPPLARSLVFTVWTAEERGLLGSEYYASNPSFPAETMAANLTLDVLQTAGPSRDVVLVGYGQNELEDDLARYAKAQGRTVTPDAAPQRGLFYRADHFSFAKRGVPTLLLMGMGGGADLVNGGREAGDRWVSDYTARCYHQTCDEWRADWDLRGAAQDIALVYEIGRDLASSDRWPGWKASSEFKVLRERSASSRR